MIQIVYDKILDFSGLADVPCVVVGSKCDLQRKYAAVFLPRPCQTNLMTSAL